ncbi:uncharacterized protein LOC110111792 [Dendrobium catenatum]|uniref:uncharacterized protein LOC110111792 n=1 Tax=Dendrobium catenatum TaxID=906689 RepID=UPI0010A04611|nr:uncharacterized protein LOC110111792 [Dendrobium catenatum]XP_028551118.1 uncharacterized protein LOC110111792 [Dendrobium catenatum]
MDFPEKYKQLWKDWDVRVLILLSLSIQIILIFLSHLRKTSALRWIRMIVWCNYLLADWVADFCLGQLSNSMDDSSSSSNVIIAFWAPFLILHLGGPDTITAYSMEDNELWARHLLGLGYELIVALYVFIRSLPNTRLLTPTLLIFIVAVIKYIERSYSLYKASTEGFLKSISSFEREVPTKDLNDLNHAFWLYSVCKPFFINAVPSSEVYVKFKDLVFEMSAEKVLKTTSMELSYAYDELYTKAVVNHSKHGYILRLFCSICIVLSFLFFFIDSKDGFDKRDVVITYFLLAASLCLDCLATIMLVFSNWIVVSLLNVKRLSKWSRSLANHIVKIKMAWHKKMYHSLEMPQLNLLHSCLKNSTPNEAPRQRMMNWISEKFGLVRKIKLRLRWRKDFETYTLWALQPEQTNQGLMNIIASYAERCLPLLLEDFNKPVGFSFLQQKIPWAFPTCFELLEGLSLDQQILIWHMTTEFCIHWPKSLHPIYYNQIEIEVDESRSRGIMRNSVEMEACKYLSNYMMHMVLMRPNMMLTMRGRSPMVFWDAFDDMVQFIYRNVDVQHLLLPNAEVKVCREIMTTPIEWTNEKSLFVTARALAHLMLTIGDEERWHVLTMIWVELLMKGANSSRADVHVKQLSRGVVINFSTK